MFYQLQTSWAIKGLIYIHERVAFLLFSSCVNKGYTELKKNVILSKINGPHFWSREKVEYYTRVVSVFHSTLYFTDIQPNNQIAIDIFDHWVHAPNFSCHRQSDLSTRAQWMAHLHFRLSCGMNHHYSINSLSWKLFLNVLCNK